MLKYRSQENTSNTFNPEETIYKHMYQLPPKENRYIVLDTETTGLSQESQIVELGAHEIKNGKITGLQFHIYIRPRIQMGKSVIDIHKITNSFYDEYYKNTYESDAQNLINFRNFLGDSIIFAHNAPFDMGMINSELRYWNLNEIPSKRFRCSMRIFMNVIGKVDFVYSEKFTKLEKCCEYFGIKSEENNYHNALFDALMTARMICKIYEKLESDVNLRRKVGYNQKCIDFKFMDDIMKKSKRYKSELMINENKKKNKEKKNAALPNFSKESNKRDEITKDKYNIILRKSESKKEKVLQNLNDNIIIDNIPKKLNNKNYNLRSENINQIKNIDNNLNSLINGNNKSSKNSKKSKRSKTSDNFDWDNDELNEDVMDDIFSELL